MVYVLAVGAALANALTSVLQRMGVEDAPDSASLTLGLLTHALKRGVWLLGFACMGASFLMQAVALHIGELTVVQPVLTTELLFLVIILAVWFQFKVGPWEWLAAVAAAAGLAGFLLFADPGGGTIASPSAGSWALIGGLCAGAVAISVAAARVGPRWWRAACFGSGSAIAYAFTAALTKVVTGFIASDGVGTFRHWQTYGLAVSGLIALFLQQNAYHAGPIAASQSTIVLIDPLASILIGVGLFGDQLRTAFPWGPLEALSLLVCFAGAVMLCHSPLISGVKGEDEREQEMLANRARHHDSGGGPAPFIGPETA